MPRRFAGAALALALVPPPAALASDDDLAADYGFDGVIVSKLHDGLFGLTAADVDGDGHDDLAVVDNGRARIDLLLHRGADAPAPETETELLNELPDEVHFRREALPTEQRVRALAVGDVDGDGRADLAFTGDAGTLTVVWSDEGPAFDRRATFPLKAGEGSQHVRIGDADGDGLVDVVVRVEDEVRLFRQVERRLLREGPRLPQTTSSPDGFALADLDGDGLADLLDVQADSSHPMRWRRGQPGGFGPERHARLDELRTWAVADVDGDASADVLVVHRRSGRVSWLRMAEAAAAPPRDGPVLSALRRVPFGSSRDGAGRDVTLADVDRDGLPDLIAAEPAAARLLLFAGGLDGQFRAAREHASLLGSSHPRGVDREGDGLPDILLAAPDEGAVAVAAVSPEGEPSFPRIVGAAEGELLALDVGDVDGDGEVETWLVVGEGKGRRREHLLRRLPDGDDPGTAVPLEDLGGDPSRLRLVDLDRDGRDDVMAFVPAEAPAILLARDDGLWRVPASTPGLGITEGASAAGVFHGDVDGDGTDELLVPAGNFARALFLDEDGAPRVVLQRNLAAPDAEVVAAAAADLDQDGMPEVILADRTSEQLVVTGAEAEVVARVDLGEFVPRGVLVADLDGNGSDDLLLHDDDGFGAILSGLEDNALEVVADYESPVKDPYLTEMAVGDVNGDGVSDLVVLETNKHLLHIARLDEGDIRHALRFGVFEGRLFESSRRSAREPREVVVADVTGDGLHDVALLVHDRVVVYPQQPAP